MADQKTDRPLESPGQLVRRLMSEKGWTQSDLAFALGSSTAAVNQILSDKRGISHNMARALSAALSAPPEIFVTAQAMWEMQKAEEPDIAIGARARILSKYPLRDMIKRGWIDPDNSERSIDEQICRFFNVSSLDDVPHLAHAAKKTRYDEILPAQLAWLFRVKTIASEMVVSSFDSSKLTDAIEALAELRSDATLVRKVPRLLSDVGVRFVIVECLPNSKIDGVCFWLDDNSPVIGMSLRFDRIDNFWFVLRHEIAHILHRHGRENPIVDVDVNEITNAPHSAEEIVANAEAADFCVQQQRMENFYLRKRPYFPDRDVVAFAKILNTHPGLVVGQIQRRIGRYDMLRQHLVKIREHLASAMMFDGWGDIVPTERYGGCVGDL